MRIDVLVAKLSVVDGESVGRHVSNIGCQRVSGIARYNEKPRYLKPSERNSIHTVASERVAHSSMDDLHSELLSCVMPRTRVTLQLSDLEF